MTSQARRLLAAALVCLGVWAVLAGARAVGLTEPLELAAHDLLYLAPEGRPGIAALPRATLVWITDADEARFGAPLPDRHLAELLRRIDEAGPRAVGLDLYRDLPVPDREGVAAEAELAARFAAMPGLNAVYKFGGIPPPRALAGSGRVGFADFVYDSGGFLRRGLLFLDDGEQVGWSLGLKLALAMLAPDGITPRAGTLDPTNLALGAAEIPPLSERFGPYSRLDARGYQFLLTFPGRGQGLRHLTVGEVLEGRYRAEDFAGRLVVIGNRSEAGKDYFFTPYSRWGSGDQRVFGAEAHAQAALQIVQMARGLLPVPRSPTEGVLLAWLALWVLLGGIAGLGVRTVGSHTLLLAGGSLFMYLVVLAAWREGWLLPLAAPFLGALAAATLVTTRTSWWERRERGELMQLFARRVSPELARFYWERREQLFERGRLAPQELPVTVLFTDLRDFTTLSENRPPAEVMAWLGEYMEAMVAVVFRWHGLVDKLTGDGVMAVFGAPLPAKDAARIKRDAADAVGCALEMGEALARFNERYAARGFPPFAMRIGIASGTVVAGTLGSAERQEFTVIGDTVNTAARLEGFDHSVGAELPCRILMTEESAALVAEGGFVLESIGETSLKGKRRSVRVVRVAGRAEEAQE